MKIEGRIHFVITTKDAEKYIRVRIAFIQDVIDLHENFVNFNKLSETFIGLLNDVTDIISIKMSNLSMHAC